MKQVEYKIKQERIRAGIGFIKLKMKTVKRNTQLKVNAAGGDWQLLP